MSDTRIEAIDTKLSPQLLEQLTRWVRLDGQIMVTSEKKASDALNDERRRAADLVMRGLLKLVETSAVTGDLAIALADRERDYVAYRSDQEKQAMATAPIE